MVRKTALTAFLRGLYRFRLYGITETDNTAGDGRNKAKPVNANDAFYMKAAA